MIDIENEIFTKIATRLRESYPDIFISGELNLNPSRFPCAYIEEADNFALTISVSVALLSVIVFATVLGTLIPLLLNKMKIDPAIATGPFITTFNDIMGLIIYLLIAKQMFAIF